MVLLEMEGVSLDVTDALEGARAAKAQGHPVTVPTEAITTVLLPWADEPWVHAATIDLQVAWATLAAAETFARRLLEGVRNRKPVIYNIETTKACNMRCAMCPRTTMMTRPVATMRHACPARAR